MVGSLPALSLSRVDTWLEAWSVYATVLLSYKPELAPDLFHYQGFITRSSRLFQAYTWLQYDAQFRLKLASNPTMKWSVTDPELVATWLSADASKHKPACYACGNPEHLSSRNSDGRKSASTKPYHGSGHMVGTLSRAHCATLYTAVA